MRRIACLFLLTPTFLAGTPANANFPAVAHGSYTYERDGLSGDETRSCTEVSTRGGFCSFLSFDIAQNGKTVPDGQDHNCAGTFRATLRFTSTTPGVDKVEVPGTLVVAEGAGRFVGQGRGLTYAAAAVASYSGALCGPLTIVPVDTVITGSYELISTF